ncbi:DNA-binding protein [Deferribacter autotrophicus]|uniref:DNA-binding protein n=1 Tax=Deferribacter autotrophicus TaxID=500465 RepID=A0A5A8EZM6_9BACT|nr:PPC domain-containing DNA-binding protein [Deferribacter autotrophicus]KAA0257130.1 DNA-binding protein [Deferribacter autotrophicus]
MEGMWYKECSQGRRFIIKISPKESIVKKLIEFATEVKIKNAVVVSAVGSVKDVVFRGIKTGAKLPITEPRMHIHRVEGPLELLGLEGNIFPTEDDKVDCHLHILVAKSSGEVLGGHLFDAEVFATCEVVVTEILASGVERYRSKSGGVKTIFIEE